MVVAQIACAPALAQERRVALVIGNGAYVHTRELPNAPNDAADMARSLEGLGFRVETVIDGDYLAMRRACRPPTATISTTSATAPLGRH
jgi:uncharacterized caspase-like protein